MAGKTLEVPFSYGSLVSVTNDGASAVLWFSDATGVIRGVPLDPSKPELLLDREILIKRKTEGQTRRRRGALPPIAASAGKK